MPKRKFLVDVSCTVEVEIDTEATSDYYEGETILSSYFNPDRFLPGSTEADVVGSLAVVAGIDNRPVGGTDGWADFPEGCVRAHVRYPYLIDDVREVTDA